MPSTPLCRCERSLRRLRRVKPVRREDLPGDPVAAERGLHGFSRSEASGAKHALACVTAQALITSSASPPFAPLVPRVGGADGAARQAGRPGPDVLASTTSP